MLCTLVIAIGTFPYALRAVATPWSLDQDNVDIVSTEPRIIFHMKYSSRRINNREAEFVVTSQADQEVVPS